MDRPCGLRPAEAGHALDMSSQQSLGAPFLQRLSALEKQALHPFVLFQVARSVSGIDFKVFRINNLQNLPHLVCC